MSESTASRMTGVERRTMLGLSGVYGFRMLGLFLILPVFALYAERLPGATPVLIGLAIGIYGLTQALLQIPFGLLSDRIGRKPVIYGGMVLFAIGSVVAARSTDIEWIIVGRAIQGSGAVAAAVMALAADLTRDDQRTKVMAGIGMSIGFSFMLAMVVGPAIDGWIGVSGIFWLTAVLAVAGILLIALVVPDATETRVHRDAQAMPSMFKRVLTNPDLLRLNYGIFSLHLILTSLFLAVPLELHRAGIGTPEQAYVYFPVMLISIIAMVPFIIVAEKKRKMKPIFLGAVALIAVVLLFLWRLPDGLWPLLVTLTFFFLGFNLLEATLPSLVSKTAPVDAKGTAMGVYSTSQFAGAFAGGLLGGWVHGEWGLHAVYLFAGLAALLWLVLAAGMRKPGRYANKVLDVALAGDAEAKQMADKLLAIPGVLEAVVVADEGSAYLKVDRDQIDETALEALVGSA